MLKSQPHGKQTRIEESPSEVCEISLGDALKERGWWPVKGFGRNRPELNEPMVRLIFRLHSSVKHADDIEYEVTDENQRAIPIRVIQFRDDAGHEKTAEGMETPTPGEDDFFANLKKASKPESE